jgi:hypothetical protein
LPEGIPALVKVGQHQSTRSVMSPILAPLSECRPRDPSFDTHPSESCSATSRERGHLFR